MKIHHWRECWHGFEGRLDHCLLSSYFSGAKMDWIFHFSRFQSSTFKSWSHMACCHFSWCFRFEEHKLGIFVYRAKHWWCLRIERVLWLEINHDNCEEDISIEQTLSSKLQFYRDIQENLPGGSPQTPGAWGPAPQVNSDLSSGSHPEFYLLIFDHQISTRHNHVLLRVAWQVDETGWISSLIFSWYTSTWRRLNGRSVEIHEIFSLSQLAQLVVDDYGSQPVFAAVSHQLQHDYSIYHVQRGVPEIMFRLNISTWLEIAFHTKSIARLSNSGQTSAVSGLSKNFYQPWFQHPRSFPAITCSCQTADTLKPSWKYTTATWLRATRLAKPHGYVR